MKGSVMRGQVLIGMVLLVTGGCGSQGPGGNAQEVIHGAAPFSPTAADGPFGIAMGQKLSDLKLKPLGAGAVFAVVEQVPVPHAEFEQVAVRGFEGVGVCAIKAVGRIIQGDGAGTGVRSAVDTLSKALRTKYGAPEKIDVCTGGVKCESQFWMMALQDGERAYAYQWKGMALKKHKFDSIIVFAEAANINDSFAAIEYHSADRAACEAAEAKGSAKGL